MLSASGIIRRQPHYFHPPFSCLRLRQLPLSQPSSFFVPPLKSSFFFSLLAGCAPLSHAPINQLNHAPEDAGWWSCPGQSERFHSRRGFIIPAAAAQDKGALPIRQQRLSRLAGVRIAVLVV